MSRIRRRDSVNSVLVRIIFNAIAIYLAARVIPDVDFRGGVWELLLAGFLFGVLNAVLKPLLVILSLPLIVLTLGVFYLVVNGLILLLLAWLLPALSVSGLLAAVLATLLMGLVNLLLHAALHAWV
ncbi:MAG: phage holin family protein [Candidatus Eisenbacteria bacterium]|jgi:putative membrane protein|nr:phage holin family protein [Candidatus Eisenbacteria bacterium]